MIIDPNYTVPANINSKSFNELPREYILLVYSMLSGSGGEEPLSIAEQISQRIDCSIHCVNPGYVNDINAVY